MASFVLDHCACCLFRSSCDRSMKGRFCPGFEKDPSLQDAFRPATPEDLQHRFTVKLDLTPKQEALGSPTH